MNGFLSLGDTECVARDAGGNLDASVAKKVIVRIDALGKRDASFGTGGQAGPLISGDRAGVVAIQKDGRIIHSGIDANGALMLTRIWP